jgi:mannose-1-phosphate guanylyltransferase/phosphomannomutase
MKGFIIAGGEGTRMRPLSLRRPKHLIPIANRPIVEYQIECLARAGVTDVVLCTSCLPAGAPQAIEAARGIGARLSYSLEDAPLDTAGALANAGAGAELEPFFAVNGDVLTDFDLQPTYAGHIGSEAQVTIAALRLPDTGPYGVLEIEPSGRVRGFREPSIADKQADPGTRAIGPGYINAGVYVMDPAALKRVPAGGRYSLERQLFPELAAAGALRVGEVAGYWLDVGRPCDVAEACWAILDRRIECGRAGHEAAPGVWRMEGARVDAGAEIRSPVHIGENASIDEAARVGPYACVGAGSRVSAGAVVERTVLLEECSVGGGAYVEGVIADRGARFEDGVRVVGPRVLAEGARVRTGDES